MSKQIKAQRLGSDSKSLQQVHDEKVRRLVYDNNSEFVPPPGFNPLPLISADQAFILYHVCGPEQCPRHQDPGFCLLGAFKTPEEARKFAAEAHGDSKFAMYMSPSHCVWPLRVRHEDQANQEANIKLTDEVCALHEANIKQRAEDHKKNVDDQKTGQAGSSLATRITEGRQARAKNPECQQRLAKVQGQAKGWRPTHDKLIIGQTFAVIFVLDDIREATLRGEQLEEPLVAFLYAAEDVKSCADYAMYTASKTYQHCDLRVVAMYSWLFPTRITEDDIGEIKIANEKIQDIINTQRHTKQKLAEFEKFYDESQIYRDLPAPDLVKEPESHPENS